MQQKGENNDVDTHALPLSVALYVSTAALAAPELVYAPSDDDEHDAASAPDDSSDESWVEEDLDQSIDDELDETARASRTITAHSARVASAARRRSSGPSGSKTSGTDAHVDAAIIASDDACQEHCLNGKEAELEKFLLSLWQLSSDQWKAALMVVLAILKETDTAVRHRGQGTRERFFFYLPFVGKVCRDVFCRCFGVSAATVARYRAAIRGGSFAPLEHAGRGNTNAAAVDLNWLVLWFLNFDATVGEVVPVRVRRQYTKDSKKIRRFSPHDYTLLPAYLTWRRIHEEMLQFVEENQLDMRTPALSTMRMLLQSHCLRVKIRSPRSNVCDVCSIYVNTMKRAATTDLSEEFGKHTAAARRMRHEYQDDLKTAGDDHAVLIMDYSQHLTIPSSTNQPASWYFLSLWSISMFGIYNGRDGIQTNYIYDERTAGKGSDEMNSLLYNYVQENLELKGCSKLTVYADNCTGQNKNNLVVKMITALAHVGDFKEVNLKFFVKGHTKNAVDRGFAHVRKKTRNEDMWTMQQLLQAVENASTSNITVHVDPGSGIVKNFKPTMGELYKDVPGLLKFQLFRMTHLKPSIVECRVDPDETPTEFPIARKIDGITTNSAKVQSMIDEHLPDLPQPVANAEKITQMHSKALPFVPVEHQQDSFYAAPTLDQEAAAQIIKRARANKYNAKKRGHGVEEDAVAQPKAKRYMKKVAQKSA